MKILVVDDTLAQRRAARVQLKALGHEVVLLSDYSEARERVRRESFDAALLDLFMPAEGATLCTDARTRWLGAEVSVGFALLLDVTAFVPRVALATDTNHHNHPMAAAVDWFIGRALILNGSISLVLHAPIVEGSKDKDWATILSLLLGASAQP